jgi:predicted PurR-regulated permease PerM
LSLPKPSSKSKILKQYKHEIIVALFIVAFAIAFIGLYGIVLPFVLGLLLAFAVLPLIKGIQKVLKKRSLSVIAFLVGLLGIVIFTFVFLIQYINRDFQRLNDSFTTLVSENQHELDAAAEQVRTYIGGLYDFEALKEELELKGDSLVDSFQNEDSSQLNTESIEGAVESLFSFFESDEESDSDEAGGQWGFFTIFFSTIGYFVLILFEIGYFEGLKNKYFGSVSKSKISVLYHDFDQSFLRYFRLRTKIVCILSLIYAITFIILDMPGTLLILALIFVLSYVPYLQYLALIPLAIGCLVLSIENGQSFLLLYGIVLGVFILSTLLEEIILTPRIMEKNVGMNPVIMVLAASIGGYLFGIPGLLLGIPMASLNIIYVKRYLLSSLDAIESKEN